MFQRLSASRATALSIAFTIAALVVGPAGAQPVAPAPASSSSASPYDGKWKGSSSGSGAACPAWTMNVAVTGGSISGRGVLPIPVHEGHLFRLGTEDTDWDVTGAIAADGGVALKVTTTDKDVDPKRREVRFSGRANSDKLELAQDPPGTCARTLTLQRESSK